MAIQHFYSQTVADGTATSVVRPSDWNSAHQQIVNLGGNTLGTSQVTGSDVVWAGGNNITLSANGSTVTIVGAAAGGGGYTANFFEPPKGNTTTFQIANAYLRPFELSSPVVVNRVGMHMNLNAGNSTRSLSGAISGVINTGATATQGVSGTVAIFTRVNTNKTNASYMSIGSYSTFNYSAGWGYTLSQSQSTNAGSATVSFSTTAGFSFLQNVNSTGGTTTTFQTQSGTSSFSSTGVGAATFGSTFQFTVLNSSASGLKMFWIPANGSSLSAGEYWFGFSQSNASGTTGSYSLQSVLPGLIGYLGYTNSTNSYMEIGASVSTNSNVQNGFGPITNAFGGNFDLSNASQAASNQSLGFALVGYSK